MPDLLAAYQDISGPAGRFKKKESFETKMIDKKEASKAFWVIQVEAGRIVGNG